MSIGTYLLLGFSAFSSVLAGAQFVLDAVRPPRWTWLRRAADVGQVPAAALGVGLSTYTAALLSATSTPLWAAAPEALAVRFGTSSVAAGAAALSLGERGRNARRLDEIALAALVAELAAIGAANHRYEKTGVAPALRETPGAGRRRSAPRGSGPCCRSGSTRPRSCLGGACRRFRGRRHWPRLVAAC